MCLGCLFERPLAAHSLNHEDSSVCSQCADTHTENPIRSTFLGFGVVRNVPGQLMAHSQNGLVPDLWLNGSFIDRIGCFET